MDKFACGEIGSGQSPNTLRPEQPAWQKVPAIPVTLSLLLLAFTLFPPVRESASLTWTFASVAAALIAWSVVLWRVFRSRGRSFRVEPLAPLRQHYIQASVQTCIYAYWGWYWGSVYSQVPLILAQLVFLYAFDGLLSWSRGRSWRLGCGPLPIILSTNVFLWFKDDSFIFQFLLIATCALGKEFITWQRNGKKTHVFNPSNFGLALFALVLIATGTSDYTWVGRIADTLDQPPQIYVVIFLLGLVVQFFFRTTLMTFSAVVSLCVLNWIYKSATGTYFFVFSNIPAPVFLGLHLLVTDPATSPRSNAGKILFGALYGLGTFVAYGVLSAIGAPTVYDKLLPVPILNLSVRWIERVTAGGVFGAFERWSTSLQPSKLNLMSMGTWATLFAVLLGAGYVQGAQEGASFDFWKKACIEGRPGAVRGMIAVLRGSATAGNAAAWNELGMLYIEGRFVERDANAALRYFAKASKAGNLAGSANVADLFLRTQDAATGKTVDAAFTQLEQECARGTDGALYFLVGRAYETGRARPLDPARALAFYKDGCARGSQDACAGASRLATPASPPSH